jgi:hypothetical protein
MNQPYFSEGLKAVKSFKGKSYELKEDLSRFYLYRAANFRRGPSLALRMTAKR